jgi:hypothetical protein
MPGRTGPPPVCLAAAELASLLRSMRSPIPITELHRQAADRELKDADGLTHLVAQLVSAGVIPLTHSPQNGSFAARKEPAAAIVLPMTPAHAAPYFTQNSFDRLTVNNVGGTETVVVALLDGTLPSRSRYVSIGT